jgi:uncharacterized protein (UPF0332 family)
MLRVDEEVLNKHYQIQVYLDHARESLESAASNIEHGFYSTAINRAYYAVFYAASGLLLTKDISRSKHSGVIAAFRQHFVGPGVIEREYSDLYGDVLDARAGSDYDMAFEPDEVAAKERLDDARRFVERVSHQLLESGWL